MSEFLFLVDPNTHELTKVAAVSLADIGIKERADLEEWVIKQPDLLGEELLVVTSEFDRFDRSDRRLDVLALDKSGNLVVVELKLDLSRSYADQQAIRYAAFCSTMVMDDVVDELARYCKLSKTEAVQRVTDFLGAADLPELTERPRVILAAGTLDDQELTSTVLWLRSYGIDISCVEMTPYRLPADGKVLLVPKVIIPLPETKDYEVRVQKKDAVVAGTREIRKWDETSFFEELQRVRGDQDVAVMRSIFDWYKTNASHFTWGTGKKTGTCIPWLDTPLSSHPLFILGTDGNILPRFAELARRPPFDDETKRKELLDKLNAVPGVSLPPGAIDLYWLGFPAEQLGSQGGVDQLLAVLGWVVGELQAAG